MGNRNQKVPSPAEILLAAVRSSGSGSGGGGGITPTGTKEIEISENGTTEHDVTNYATAKITVDVPEPEGTKEITISENGATDHDVSDYATAHVVVSVPGPSGTKHITTNGTHDVAAYASAEVNVPNPSTGTKEISIQSNGQTTEDVTEYASVHITTAVPEPSGETEISISANGTTTHDVTDFASAKIVVNVPSSGGGSDLSGMIDGSVTAVSDADITYIRDHAFSDCSSLASVDLPAATEAGMNAFSECSSLASVNLPLVTKLGQSCFQYCESLTDAHFLKLASIPNMCFYGCSHLKKVKADVATSVFNAFQNCTLLEVLDILGGSSWTFNANLGSTNLKSLVIRATDGVMSCGSSTYFNAQASIYVADSLVDAYKSATNWSDIADQIKPLSTYTEEE